MKMNSKIENARKLDLPDLTDAISLYKKEAYNLKYITNEMLNSSINNNYISREFCEIAKII